MRGVLRTVARFVTGRPSLGEVLAPYGVNGTRRVRRDASHLALVDSVGVTVWDMP